MNAEMDLVNFAVEEARSKGATYAEARYEKQDPENFILKNGVLDALYVGHDQGIGVRVLVNGALGFAATNSLSKAGVRAIVGDAIKIAKASRRKTKITFAQEDSIAMNWSIPEAKKLADVIRWALTDGEKDAAALAYAPLPASLVARLTPRIDSLATAGSR